mmetsp:Transcript_48529/g.99083  ORF Transcript_48529/g.99083 Transcript_48529/m.99083 type:complete len:407 (-) Transcript_48529:1544-2764(-)
MGGRGLTGWTLDAIRGECYRRGVVPLGIPDELFRASRWAARAIAKGGTATHCHSCELVSTTHLWCVSCSTSTCRRCLKLQDEALWDITFECAACSIESVCVLDNWTPPETDLINWANGYIRTRSLANKPGTWRLYQQCIREVIQFMLDTKIVIFPVVDDFVAKGLCMFFIHLKLKGTSWTKMATFQSALTNASRAAGLHNPWKRYPRLEELSAGLSRELTTPTTRREGVTIKMVKRIIADIEQQLENHTRAGRVKKADTALRNLVAICLGFFAMRRGSELWLNKSRRMGLRRCQVEIVWGSHVVLFIQSMKNDTTAKGTEVVIAWVTASGIPIGEYIACLHRRLDECGIPLHGPFSPKGSDGYVLPARGKESRFNGILAKYLPQIWAEFENPTLRKRFSWHSLRRG